MDSNQPSQPRPPLDHAGDDAYEERWRRWRRLPTTAAIAGLVTVAGLLVAMWAIAATNGHVRLLMRYYSDEPGFHGNHGPWRQHRVLRGIYDYVMLVTVFGVMPLAWFGAMVEGRRRAVVVAILATILLVVCVAHFELFD